MSESNFNKYPLSEPILKALELLHFNSPTEVQQQVMPTLFAHKDIIVRSQTGSGKTGAFAIPICEMVDWEENKPQAIIITPTRELAIQVKEDCFHIGRFKRLKVSALIGKAPFHLQEKELKQKTHIVVGTPGRILDHLDRGTLDTSMIEYLVIDEADEMLRMGFVEQVEAILKALPNERVNVVLSATMPPDIEALCLHYLNQPEIVMVESESTTAERIEQYLYNVSENKKMGVLNDLLVIENPDSCIVFANTQSLVEDIYRVLSDMGLSCDRIHGGMEQSDRLKVMENFKRGYFRYLVATDVAARGIDVEKISLVINFEVPFIPENYVHRIGRTGRKEHEGKALTLASGSEKNALNDLQTYLGNEIPNGTLPTKEDVAAAEEAFDEKNSKRPERKADKGEKLSTDIMKLHINAGKKTKMRAVDVVGTLCSIEGVTSEDIGIINIMDISTYVEILNGKGNMVLKALQDKPIKGRIRRVSKSDK